MCSSMNAAMSSGRSPASFRARRSGSKPDSSRCSRKVRPLSARRTAEAVCAATAPAPRGCPDRRPGTSSSPRRGSPSAPLSGSPMLCALSVRIAARPAMHARRAVEIAAMRHRIRCEPISPRRPRRILARIGQVEIAGRVDISQRPTIGTFTAQDRMADLFALAIGRTVTPGTSRFAARARRTGRAA